MAQSVKSQNGKTEWIYNDGELIEIGPTHPKLTRSVVDTYKLYTLLLINHDDLTQRYEEAIHGHKQKPMRFIAEGDYGWNEDE